MKKDRLCTVTKGNRRQLNKRLLVGGGSTYVDTTGQSIYSPNSYNTDRTTSQQQVVNFDKYKPVNNALATTQNLQDLTTIDNDPFIGTGQPKDIVYTDIEQDNDGVLNTNNTAVQIGTQAANYGTSLLNNTSAATNTASSVGSASTALTTPYTYSLTAPVLNTAYTSGANTFTNALRSGALSSIATDYAAKIGEQAANFGKDAFGKSFENRLADAALSSSIKTGALSKFSSLLGADKLTSLQGAGIGAAASILGGVGKSLISDGLSTKTGNTIANVGNIAGGVVGAINPVIGGIVTLAGNVIGGAVNRGWGHEVKGKAAAQNYLNQMSGVKIAGNNDDIETLASQLTPAKRTTYRDGWFTDKGKDESNAINNQLTNTEEFLERSINNAAINNIAQQQQRLLAGYYGNGGALLTRKAKRKREDNMHTDKNINVVWKEPFLFGLGGVTQTHGSDFSNGVTEINAGGSHETNPNEGVQLSTDSEGTPNMVEEGEVVWNDFVFSNRINVSKAIRHKYGIRGAQDITFADAAKKLQKESEERPNDPISRAGLDASLEDLANEQETLKQQEAVKKAQEKFMSLSPEEQQAIMQELAARQQAAQEQAVAQQQISPEQQEALQQQATQEQALQNQVTAQQQVQPNVSAYGGNLYKDGGKLLNFLKSLGFKSTAEAEKAGFTPKDFGVNSWTDINSETVLPENFEWNTGWNNRLGKEIQARLALGWSPTAKLVEPSWYEATNGNKIGWSASVPKTELTLEEFNDAVNRYKNTLGYAVKQGWIKAPEEGGTVSTEAIQKAMERTPDWIATDKWLYNDANARQNQEEYLGKARTLNDEDDQSFIDAWSKYGDFTTDDGKNYTFKFKEGLSDADYDEALEKFKKARNDYYLGVMHNSRTSVPEAITNYQYDPETGKVLGVLTDTNGYQSLGDTFTWGDNGTNRSARFWVTKDSANGKDKGSTTLKEVEPVHKAEWPRYVGLMGPAVGIGLQMAGVGKPDYSDLDAAVAASAVDPIPSKYKPIGDYMKYKPLDRDYYINKLNAQAGATRRAVLNSGSTPSRGAQILAADYNHVNRLGDLARQAEEYNLNQREKVATFNRGTNLFNAEAYNKAALQYASDYNKQKLYNAQQQMEAAQLKDNSRANWYNSLYGNIGQLATGFSSLGKENAQHNMLADMAAQGVFGVIDPDSPMGMRVVRYKSNKAARGGKVNKRKRGGLTY